ncbi:hypothetical protein C8J57DRAFT_1220325 [Mycena rebaudengoi]|nr:hypothetical protein C8J57DRAFT_1220325 [Mycena rebaudengoi]
MARRRRGEPKGNLAVVGIIRCQQILPTRAYYVISSPRRPPIPQRLPVGGKGENSFLSGTPRIRSAEMNASRWIRFHPKGWYLGTQTLRRQQHFPWDLLALGTHMVRLDLHAFEMRPAHLVLDAAYLIKGIGNVCWEVRERNAHAAAFYATVDLVGRRHARHASDATRMKMGVAAPVVLRDFMNGAGDRVPAAISPAADKDKFCEDEFRGEEGARDSPVEVGELGHRLAKADATLLIQARDCAEKCHAYVIWHVAFKRTCQRREPDSGLERFLRRSLAVKTPDQEVGGKVRVGEQCGMFRMGGVLHRWGDQWTKWYKRHTVGDNSIEATREGFSGSRTCLKEKKPQENPGLKFSRLHIEVEEREYKELTQGEGLGIRLVFIGRPTNMFHSFKQPSAATKKSQSTFEVKLISMEHRH